MKRPWPYDIEVMAAAAAERLWAEARRDPHTMTSLLGALEQPDAIVTFKFPFANVGDRGGYLIRDADGVHEDVALPRDLVERALERELRADPIVEERASTAWRAGLRATLVGVPQNAVSN